MLRALQRSVDSLALCQERAALRQERAELERLFITRVPHTPGSWASQRSPPPNERFSLKMATIDYYGLWASKEGDDSTAWTVHPMLAADGLADGKPAPLPFKEAILSHVWPSKGGGETDKLAALPGLPPTFSVEPRNFLILPKFFEQAFDGDAMLLLPHRGQPPGVSVRLHRLDVLPPADAAKLRDFCSVPRKLYFPGAADGKLPFLRALGWKALSALRAQQADAAEAAEAAVPEFFDADVSMDADGVAPLRAALDRAARVGVRFQHRRGAG